MADIKSAMQQALAIAAANPAAVTQALAEWEADDAKPAAPTLARAPTPIPTIQEATTMTDLYADLTISEQTFNLIRDTPYVLMTRAIDLLSARGHNYHTTSSLISQMVRQGMVSRDKDNKLTALQKKYTPIQSMKSRAYLAAASKALKSKKKNKLVKMPREVRVPVFIPEQVKTPKGIAALNSKPVAAPIAVPTQATAEVPPTHMTAAQVLETLSIKEAHILYRELQTMFG